MTKEAKKAAETPEEKVARKAQKAEKKRKAADVAGLFLFVVQGSLPTLAFSTSTLFDADAAEEEIPVKKVKKVKVAAETTAEGKSEKKVKRLKKAEERKTVEEEPRKSPRLAALATAAAVPPLELSKSPKASPKPAPKPAPKRYATSPPSAKKNTLKAEVRCRRCRVSLPSQGCQTCRRGTIYIGW